MPLVFLLFVLALPGAAAAEGVVELPVSKVFPAEGPFRAALDRDGLDVPLADAIARRGARTGKKKCVPSIVIEKAARRLDAYCGDEVVKSYVVNLGLRPVPDKVRQGDYATPEGKLYVCTFNEKSQFYRFLGLAYPDPEDAKRGLAAGLVSARQAAAIEAAHRKKACPPWETKLGGAVGIHGGGSWERDGDVIRVFDWTWGCIGLRDPDVKELFYGFARPGTAVEIRP